MKEIYPINCIQQKTIVFICRALWVEYSHLIPIDLLIQLVASAMDEHLTISTSVQYLEREYQLVKVLVVLLTNAFLS